MAKLVGRALAVVAVSLLALLLWTPRAWGGKANVLFVEATQESEDLWTFSVTVSHDDKGPTHWADFWRVRTPEGKELGRRVLLHSHEGEQPVTRDAQIRIPPTVRIVVVEAHDKLHGLGGATVTLDLTKPAGQSYTVTRRRP